MSNKLVKTPGSGRLGQSRGLKLLKKALLLFVILGVLLVPAYFSRVIRKHEIQTNPVKSRQAGGPMPVKTYPVKMTTITEEIGASAEVQPSSFAYITSTLAGIKVKAVHVDVGDYVEEGQILFELDRTLLVSALRSAEDQVEMTKAKLEQVKQTQTTLHDELVAAVKSAETEVEKAKAKFEEIKQTRSTAHEELVAAVNSAKGTVDKTKARLEEVEKTRSTQHEELLANLKKSQDEVESNKARLEEVKRLQPTRHDEWIARLESTKAAVISNKSTLQVSEAALTRQKNLTGQSIVSKSTLEQAQNALDIAKSSYAKSLEDQIIAQNNLKNEEVTNRSELSAATFNYSASLLNLKVVQNSLKNEELTNNSVLTDAKSNYASAQENLIKAQNALANEELSNKSMLAEAENQYYTALENLLKAQNALKHEQVTAQAELTSAISSYTTALQTLTKAQYDLDNATVRSPIVGVITERNINPGEIIGGTGGSSLLVIGNIEPAMVVANVAEEKLTSIHLGQTAKITLDSLPNQILEGTVVKIEPNTNPETRTFKVHARVDNPNHILKPGLSAFVRIQNSRTVPTVPKVAIVDSAGKASAFVVDSNSTAQLRYVKVGLTGDGLVEVLSGVNEGENVVTIGQTMLKDGDKVRVIKDLIN